MRAIRNAPPTVEVIETDDPEGDGELIRVAAAGICASDLMYLDYGSRQIAGHEFAGTLQDGTPVAVEALFGCESCRQCEQGNYNRCEASGPTALGMLQAGGMSEYFIAPRRAVIRLPSGLDVNDACLVEPASVALHGCHAGHVGPDTRVAVVGAGAIGILAAVGVQSMGGSEVALEARHPHQHEARERVGAEVPTDHYDVVIETAGSESGLRRGSSSLARAAPSSMSACTATSRGLMAKPSRKRWVFGRRWATPATMADGSSPRPLTCWHVIPDSATSSSPIATQWRTPQKHSESPRTGRRGSSEWSWNSDPAPQDSGSSSCSSSTLFFRDSMSFTKRSRS